LRLPLLKHPGVKKHPQQLNLQKKKSPQRKRPPESPEQKRLTLNKSYNF
jgi:hypothetical protein